MRLGINVAPADLPDALTAFPGAYSVRVFGSPGKGIPAWTSPTITTLTRAGKVPWVSFKDWNSDSAATLAVKTWLDAMPAATPEAWLTYNHEPEGDLDSGEYRRRWVLLTRTVRRHTNAARIRLVPIHTLYPSRHKIGDTYNTDWTKWVGIWQQWAPFDGTTYCGDFMGWDCYLETTAKTYEDPESFFRIPIGAAYTVNAPLVIPELGAIRTATDTTGIERAVWITRCLEYLQLNNTIAVNWWHSIGSAGQDYRLDDAASLAAWRDATARVARQLP